MLARALLALALVAPPLRAPQGVAPVVRVRSGEARVAAGRVVSSLDRRSEPLVLETRRAWLESGARAEVELVWRGVASASVTGPAAVEVGRAPALRVEHAAVVELELRRGTLVLELAGAGEFELAPCALQVRGLPGGAFEVLNRGGREVGLGDARVAPGRRVRLAAARD